MFFWACAEAQLEPRAPTRERQVAQPLPATPALEETLAILGSVVDHRAGEPGNARLNVHGILARGADFRLSDGTVAADALLTRVEPGRGFPRGIEPHTDQILKNLGEAGVKPGTAQLDELYRWTVQKTWLDVEKNATSFASLDDMPWGVQAIAQWAPDDLRWTATNGMAMDMDVLTDFTVALLLSETKFIATAMEHRQPFTREGQGLFDYTCGGAHLLQGASYAVGKGFGSPKARVAIEQQAAIQIYRLPLELTAYDRALAEHPEERARLLAQRLKFLGHWLESQSKLEAMGLYTPTPAQRRHVEGAAIELAATVRALDLAGLDPKDEHFLDLVCDAAHALRGLELALGRAGVWL